MTSGAPRFAMVAGEASGDLLAAMLLGGLKTRWPQLQAFGVGGPKMDAQGFSSWWPHDKLAVRGYVEVLRHYREIVEIRKQLGFRLLLEKPDVFIGIDAPDFNLELEARLKRSGVKTIHFISPAIWAWRPQRMQRIARAVDLTLCVFPFEPALYAEHGVAATYVGHPLADVIPLKVPRDASRDALGLSGEDTVVALLPGSRRTEIDAIAPRLFGAADVMRRQRPNLRFVLSVAPGMREPIERLAGASAVTLLDGGSHEALAACDVALVASGTATLEAALFKRPMVIAYNMHWLSWQMTQRKRLQPWVGLPNILLREFVVPELLQDEATPERLARAALEWLDDPERVQAVARRFTQLHLELRRNTAQAATDAIEKVLAG
ncbi:MAG: lipid-A-disaccharide synthase [Burkholderiaceae bacterium]|nr:lipid-A-disaccharide synthase [Burkholderiaceae bacterium]